MPTWIVPDRDRTSINRPGRRILDRALPGLYRAYGPSAGVGPREAVFRPSEHTMNILYPYEKDATSRRTQSGRPNSIYTRMVSAGHHVDLLRIQPSQFRKPRLKQIFYR